MAVDAVLKCAVCDGIDDWYMVLPAVWRQAWPTYYREKAAANRAFKAGMAPRKRFLLCFRCLEQRLCRKLTIDDFNLTLPINSGVALGYALGLSSRRSMA